MIYLIAIIFFILGYFFCKKKDQLITFLNAMKFLYSKSKEKQIYNDFFETNFNESDYVNNTERGEIENV